MIGGPETPLSPAAEGGMDLREDMVRNENIGHQRKLEKNVVQYGIASGGPGPFG